MSVVQFGTEEFFAHPALDSIPALAGSFDGGIQLVLSGGPDGDVKVLTRFEGGRAVARSFELDKGAEVTITLKWPDALAVLDGETGLNVLYMTGRLKTADVSGTGPLLDLIAALDSDAGCAALGELAEATTGR